jgi:dTDP-4-dehydrorhamnose 3,5-epimerase
MDGVVLTPLKQIKHPLGDIYHAMKKSDKDFSGFGEAYFSTVNQGSTKGWKKHTKMVLNLIVPIGEIEFVIYNESTEKFYNVKLSQKNYQRLSISPGLWVAFKGHKSNNVLLNIASIEHNSAEAISMPLDSLSFNWVI